MFVFAILFLLLLVALFSFIENEKPSTRWIVFAVVVFALTLLAGFRPIGIDKDSLQYYGYFVNGTNDFVEESFIIIANISEFLFSDARGVFLIYALLAIPLKCFVFTKLSTEYFLLLAVYLSNFFVLHDLTQIRVGVAMAFVFAGFYFVTLGRRYLFVFFILIATCFHYSAIIAIVILFMRIKELKKWMLVVLGIVPVLTISCGMLNIDMVSMLPIEYLQDRLEVYERLRDKGVAGDEELNLFNAAIMLKLMVFYFLLWKYNIIKEKCSYLPLLLQLFALSYLCFGLFSFMAVLASRVSELYCFVEILMVPLIIHAFEPKWVGRLFVLVYCVGIFLINVVYAELLKF